MICTYRWRERFLSELEKVAPWTTLLRTDQIIQISSPLLPMAAETMLGIHLMQQWHALSDPAMGALYEIESTRHFAGLESSEDGIPDETTIRNSMVQRQIFSKDAPDHPGSVVTREHRQTAVLPPLGCAFV